MIWKHTIAASMIMLAAFSALIYLSQPEEIRPNKPFSTFPTQIGKWEGKEDRFDEKIYRVLGVDDSFYANYRDEEGKWINLYIGFYQSQREGELIHSPKNCMPGGGWQILDSKVIPIKLNDASSTEISIIKLTLQNGKSRQISYYWYQSGARVIASEYMLKIYLVWDAITRNRTDGSFIRLISPVATSEEETLFTLENFVRDLFPILREYIPL